MTSTAFSSLTFQQQLPYLTTHCKPLGLRLDELHRITLFGVVSFFVETHQDLRSLNVIQLEVLTCNLQPDTYCNNPSEVDFPAGKTIDAGRLSLLRLKKTLFPPPG